MHTDLLHNAIRDDKSLCMSRIGRLIDESEYSSRTILRIFLSLQVRARPTIRECSCPACLHVLINADK